MSKTIMGIEIQSRHKSIQGFQKIISDFGCIINTRVGLHEASKDVCSEKGLIILEFIEDADKEVKEMEEQLASIPDIIVKKMVF